MGARYHWAGNKQVGEGSMTILASVADSRIETELRFIKPFRVTNTTAFTLEPAEGGTKVTWAMEGTNGFAMKAFGVFMNMDTLVGRDFEKGLAGMQDAAREDRAEGAAGAAVAKAA